MLPSLIRIAVLIAIGFGAWKFYPNIKPIVQPAINNPAVLGAQILHPAINTINGFLPDNIQIPINDTKSSENQEGDVNGSSTTASGTENTIINTIVEDVKQKAQEVAKDQIDAAKEEAGKAFCQVLIEKIKTECGQ